MANNGINFNFSPFHLTSQRNQNNQNEGKQERRKNKLGSLQKKQNIRQLYRADGVGEGRVLHTKLEQD